LVANKLAVGAGISTSCGVEDFRGKGGKWTERDRERKFGLLLPVAVVVQVH
jgi:NAD-dependent SIR2 family protein deacetylase